jgi:hypothetical protein
MGILRGIGYFFSVISLLIGLVLFPIGIPIIIGSIIVMWALHKGGQVSAMKKDVKALKEIQQATFAIEMEKARQDALRKKTELEKGWE